MSHQPKLLITIAFARDLIADPRNWLRGRLATTKAGSTTTCTGRYAYRWCMFGALIRAGFKNGLTMPERTAMTRLVTEQVKRRGYNNIATFNDAEFTTHKDVMNVFTDALRDHVQ